MFAAHSAYVYKYTRHKGVEPQYVNRLETLHRPIHEVELGASITDSFELRHFHLLQTCLRFHLTGPKDSLPQGDKAVRAVAKHTHRRCVRAYRPNTHTFLRSPGVHAEYDRARLGGEQGRKKVGELGLLLLAEKVEESSGVDGGEPATQRRQSGQGGQVHWRLVYQALGRDGSWLEERFVKYVTRDKFHGEGLGCRIENFVTYGPEV